jgi:uncharacterized ferritin-like protein (DUF455 family)
MSTPLTLDREQKRLARYRFLENQMMSLMGGWVQTIEDADVKVAFGRHLYEDALHSDALKRRLPELNVRSERHQEAAPSDAFVGLLDDLWPLDGDLPRLVALYRVLKPHYVAILETHLTEVFAADEPTARIVEDILRQERHHIQWAERTIERLRAAAPDADTDALEASLRAALDATGGIARLDEVATAAPAARTFAYSRRPVRDARWTVVDEVTDYDEKGWTFETQTGKQHLLHDLLNSEYVTVERLGQMLAEFPDLPWAMRLDLARQVWDEARHAEVIEERLLEVGGHVGMYPINFWGWEVDVNRPDPLERLALSNATFERESCKHVRTWIREARAHGDIASASVLEYVLADEVTHVQFGQTWITRLTENDPERRERVFGYPREVLEDAHPAGTRFDEVAR